MGVVFEEYDAWRWDRLIAGELWRGVVVVLPQTDTRLSPNQSAQAPIEPSLVGDPHLTGHESNWILRPSLELSRQSCQNKLNLRLKARIQRDPTPVGN